MSEDRQPLKPLAAPPPPPPPPGPPPGPPPTGAAPEGKRLTMVFYQPVRTVQYPDLQVEKNQQANLMYSARESELLQEIFHILITKHPNVLREFFTLCENKDQWEDLADSLLTMTFARSTTLNFVRYFVNEEFANHSSADLGSLFRENSMASKIIKAYLRKVGQNYINELLAPTLHQICIDERKCSYEIDPSKLEDPEELEHNKEALIAKVDLLLNKITSPAAMDKMPPGIKIIACYFWELAQKYFPDLNALPLVGSFLMLRYLNPAIFSPEQYGLIPQGKTASPKARRNLILITKILQNLSNFTVFKEKESYMTKLNEFVQKNSPKLQQYFKQIVAAAQNCSSNLVIDSDLCAVSVKDLHLLHMLLFQHKDVILSLIAQLPERTEFEKKLDALGSYSSKVSFASTLDATEQKHVKEMLTQKNDEASFIGWLDTANYATGKKEKEGGKEGKDKKVILVIGMNWIFTMKRGGKLIREGHSLDLKEIISTTSKEVRLNFGSFEIAGDSEQADEIIHCIRRAFLYNFSGMPKEKHFKLNLLPSSRITEIVVPTNEPCGGFVGTYKAMCNYHRLAANSSICWDIENLYSNNTNFDFQLFFSEESVEDPNAMATSELVPIFQALRYNSYFKSVSFKERKLDKALTPLVELLRNNSTLTALTLSNISISSSAFYSLFEAMSQNTKCLIEHIDVSDNVCFDEKVITALGSYLVSTQAPQGVLTLKLSNTCTNTKALVALATILCNLSKSPRSSNLAHLDISRNKLSDCSSNMAQWFSMGQSSLRYLNVGYTGLSGSKLTALLTAISKGCRNLATFEAAGLKLAKQEESVPLSQLVSQVASLTELNLSGTIAAPAVLQDILQACPKDGNLMLNLSGNILGAAYFQALNTLVPKLSSVTTLDLSDTELGDDGVFALVEGLLLNTNLMRLNINGCFNKTTKQRSDVIRVLCKLIASDCPIETLNMAGGSKAAQQLSKSILPFIQALATNTTLTEIDLSGHLFGNNGAIALAKILQLNTTLNTIFWDDNQTNLIGLTAVNHALKINETVRCMPLPVNDLALLLGSGGEDSKRKVKALCAEIQQSIISHGGL
eukprot:TRINITY_DN6307_c0_g1_i1.p1 TRINITY_DN6307_c0_g1~~TRINITY_DN6307_c0_g1_i1.p1  ORF type:complete len:1080 (+),score=357.09 TRINITY_DN6307_c0_g1_i1:23-3262(+)